MKKLLLLWIISLTILGNDAGEKRAREDVPRENEKTFFDEDYVDVNEEKITSFCQMENPLKQTRMKRAPEWHSSDNDAQFYQGPSGQLAINKLVASYLSDPECEGRNIFVANPSGLHNIGQAKLDFDALINSNCIAVERHNLFYGLSRIPSIAMQYRKYCDSQRAGQPLNRDRKNLLRAIKDWTGNVVNPIVDIPDICLKMAAKLRLRLENAREEGAQSGVGNSNASTSRVRSMAPAPFQGNNPCRDLPDCNIKSYLCFENDYEADMGEMCPITCRYCREGEFYNYNYRDFYGLQGCIDRAQCNPMQCYNYVNKNNKIKNFLKSEDYKIRYCALSCQRCSTFLRFRY